MYQTAYYIVTLSKQVPSMAAHTSAGANQYLMGAVRYLTRAVS